MDDDRVRRIGVGREAVRRVTCTFGYVPAVVGAPMIACEPVSNARPGGSPVTVIVIGCVPSRKMKYSYGTPT